MAKKVKYYTPGKNRRRRKHYWWRYLLVFLLGQALVLPSFILTLGTAASSVELKTFLSMVPNSEKYLASEYQDETIMSLVMTLIAKPDTFMSYGGLASISPILDDVFNDYIQKYPGDYGVEINKDDFYTTTFDKMPDYLMGIINNVELGKILEAIPNVPIPAAVTDLFFNTPVAYFDKADTSVIEAVPEDSFDLAESDFEVLPAVATNPSFNVEVAEGVTGIQVDGSKVTIAKDTPVGTIFELTAKPNDSTRNDFVKDVSFTLEVKDNLKCKQVQPYYDRDKQIIIWKNIDHAKTYKVDYQKDLYGTNKEITNSTENFIELKSEDGLVDGNEYTYKITTIGKDANHADSDELEFTFKYTAPAAPVNPDPTPDPQKPDDDPGEKGSSRVTREEKPSQDPEPSGDPSTEDPQTETVQKDETGSYVNALGVEESFDHPNGYYDDDGALIRTGLKIGDLSGMFSDIGSLFGNKTIGDLMGMFGMGSSTTVSKDEPKIPVISQRKQASGIMDVLGTLKISDLMGGDIMSAFSSIALGDLMGRGSDNPIMAMLEDKTISDLTSGDMFNSLKIGDLLGIYNEDGSVKDGTSSLLVALGDCSLSGDNSITNKIPNLTVGEIFPPEQLDGTMLESFKNDKVMELGTSFNSKYLYEVFNTRTYLDEGVNEAYETEAVANEEEFTTKKPDLYVLDGNNYVPASAYSSATEYFTKADILEQKTPAYNEVSFADETEFNLDVDTLYVLDKSGNYTVVDKGAGFDATATYYKLGEATKLYYIPKTTQTIMKLLCETKTGTPEDFLTIGDMSQGNKLSDVINQAKIRDLLGDSDDRLVQLFLDCTLGNIGDRINTLKINEIMDANTLANNPFLKAIGDYYLMAPEYDELVAYTESEFNNRTNDIYILNGSTYVKVADDAIFDSETTYYVPKGQTVSEGINTLKLGQIMTITEGQSPVLDLLSDKYLYDADGRNHEDTIMGAIEGLTIGEAMGIDKTTETNQILVAIADEPVMGGDLIGAIQGCKVKDILGEDNIKGNPMLEVIGEAYLSGTSISSALDKLTLVDFVGVGTMFKMEPEEITDESTFNSLLTAKGELYSDLAGKTKVTAFDSNITTYYYTNGLTGIWKLVFADEAEAKSTPVQSMGTIVGNLAKTIMTKTLFELQDAGIIAQETDLTKTVITFVGDVPVQVQMGSLTIQGLIDVVSRLSA